MAVTTVGEARKFIVSLLPSLRDLKLRLNDVRIAVCCQLVRWRFERESLHTILLALLVVTFPLWTISVCDDRWDSTRTCPMQGPQAFANTVAPTSWSWLVIWSRSMVARICSEPGVQRNGTLVFRPAAFACLARSATLVFSRALECEPKVCEFSVGYAPCPRMNYWCTSRSVPRKARPSSRSPAQKCRISKAA